MAGRGRSGARRSSGIQGVERSPASGFAGPCASGDRSENGPDHHDNAGATGGGETDWDAGVAGKRRVAAEGLMSFGTATFILAVLYLAVAFVAIVALVVSIANMG
jgi:hypothetical protein